VTRLPCSYARPPLDVALGQATPPLRRDGVVAEVHGEIRPLSGRSLHDALSHAYSYYASDMVVIDYWRALIIEPGPEVDVADVRAGAHAQLLELW